MKIKDAINMANLMEQGNVLPKELAILFLSELDGMIQSDIMLHAPEEIVSYTDEEQELLLRPPHDKLYVHYLVMMIRNQQQEYEGYQNTQAAVDEKLKTFRRWYVQHYRPADTDSRSYTGGTSADAFGFAYLTAYGLAVKHGYTGTEEQWLESLHGETGAPGEPARMRYDAAREMIQWGVGDTWYDLFSLQALRDPVVAEFLAEAESSAQSALRSAEAANRAAGTAQSASSQSQAAAGSAENHAVTAGNYAKAAEESAQRAEAAAGNAGNGSTGDINDAIANHEDNLAAHAAMQNNLNALRDEAISGAIDSHSADSVAHADIRNALEALRNRVNAALNSDDVTLDQMAEIVAYIKSNKTLIDAITTSKVSVSDIVDDLTTYLSDRPLSAAMGAVLRDAQRELESKKLDASKLDSAIDTALAQAKASGVFDGEDGKDGADGRGIKSIARTSGNGAAGTTDTYTITYTDGTKSTFTVRNGTNGTNGKDGADGKDGVAGKTPVKGVDYFTTADKAELAGMVLELLQGKVISGYVAEDGSIVINGLPDGNYTVKYEMADGSTLQIGELVLDTRVYYSVTGNLSNCVSSNSAISAPHGDSYQTTITANAGYELESVTVTMGGVDITAQAVNGGSISIASVTGDVVITAVAKEAVVVPTYNNLFDPSKAVLNSRLNSSKVVTSDANATGKIITNFMNIVGKTPFTSDSKVYIKGATFTPDANTKLLTYKNATTTDYTTSYSQVNGSVVTVTDEGNGVVSFSGATSNIASSFAAGVTQMVLVLKVSDSAITAADIQDIVITVDEPIT